MLPTNGLGKDRAPIVARDVRVPHGEPVNDALGYCLNGIQREIAKLIRRASGGSASS
jgi:hypothetical protein